MVAETLDGEATIVDLDSGTYYALNESGSLIWDALLQGSTPATVAGAVASAYSLDEAEAARAVDALVDQLTKASLIVPADAPSANGNGAPATAAGNGSGPFIAPELSTYTDMQELLLLDPIHEVDESGWPTPG